MDNINGFYDHLNMVFEAFLENEEIDPVWLKYKLFINYDKKALREYFSTHVAFTDNGLAYFDSVVQAVAYAMLDYKPVLEGEVFSILENDKVFCVDIGPVNQFV